VTSETLGEVDGVGSLAMLVARQIEAIDAWNVAREQREAMYEAPPSVSRELRLDFARRLDVLHRVHEAMLSRAAESLAHQPCPILSPLPRRALIAHRQEWFVNQLTEALREHGITVVAATNNGADALGFVVAEQPDVLLVEDKLSMLTGAELVAKAAIFAPHTIVAAHVRDNAGVGHMLNAGARNAFARQVPPADIADALARMVHGAAAA
jgi:CheY-like chemotaxis protein